MRNKNQDLSSLRDLKDSELLARTEFLAREERRIAVSLVEHLREVYRRKLFADCGCDSLFKYCLRILKMSEAQAQRSIDAMRLTETLPEAKVQMEQGEISLSVASQLQSFIRREEKRTVVNLEKKRELLQALQGKSCREAERELLKHTVQPEQHLPEKVRAVSPTHSQIQFTASQEQMALFEKARGLLAHAHPEMNWSELFEAMARKVIAQLDPREKKTRRTIPPANGQTASSARAVPAALKRAVWQRDQGKCVQCGSEHALEMDHCVPFALGGETTFENLRLLCRACNAREAIRSYGLPKMEREMARR